MRWRRRPVRLPPPISRALQADEVVTGYAVDRDGIRLASTRRRLLVLRADDTLLPISWFEVAKARLDAGVLTLIPLRLIGPFAGSGDLLIDAPALTFAVGKPNRLTDQVHHRVRRSVAAGRHLPWPGAGGWVTTRRVAGENGLLLQLRLDAGADPAMPGFLEAAERMAIGLVGEDAPGVTGVDD